MIGRVRGPGFGEDRRIQAGLTADWPLAGNLRLICGSALLVLVVGLALLALQVQRPPAPASATAALTDFSAQRAWEHLEAIAGGGPTPLGTAGNEQVRSYLLSTLSSLGLEVEVQEAIAARPYGDTTNGARVYNLIAVIPGTDPSGRIYLTAHYDSGTVTPGASDDKAAVAAIVESARALLAGEGLRNDIVLLLTDGEEEGLLGAQAFVDEHPMARQGGLVLNWEAIGNSGPAVLFQLSPGNSGFIDAFARAAPHPVGEYALATFYEEMPNDTDFTVFRSAGFEGMNFALLDGHAFYHSPLDTPENLEIRSVQQMGENMLALAREFGSIDLATFDTATDSVYLSLFDTVIDYPAWLSLPLTILALLLLAQFTALARRRRLATLGGTVAGFAATLLPLALIPLATVGLWEVFILIRPEYSLMADPYRPEPHRWAVVALSMSLFTAWYLFFRRLVGALALITGGLAWLALLAITALWLLPGVAYYGYLPLLFACAGGVFSLLIPARFAVARIGVVAVGVLPGVLLLTVSSWSMFAALGMSMAAGAAFMLVLIGILLMPLLEPVLLPGTSPVPRSQPALRMTALPALSLLAAIISFMTGLIADRFGPERPVPTHLMYVHDASEGQSWWASGVSELPDWTASFVEDGSVPDALPPLLDEMNPFYTGRADQVSLQTPRLEIMEDERIGDRRRLELELGSPRQAPLLVLHSSAPVDEVVLQAPGLNRAISRPRYSSDDLNSRWPYQLKFYNPPPEGLRVRLELRVGGEEHRFRISDYSTGLSGLPGYRPRPAWLTATSWRTADAVVLSDEFTLPALDANELNKGRVDVPGTVEREAEARRP